MKPRIEDIENFQPEHGIALKCEAEIENKTSVPTTYYFRVSAWARVAIGQWARGDDTACRKAAVQCVKAVIDYFYGHWRKVMPSIGGDVGEAYWRRRCLWLEELQRSLPFALALSDWTRAKRISAYPPSDAFPEAITAQGEAAWCWALVMFIRGDKEHTKTFLDRLGIAKGKRLRLLAEVLQALVDRNQIGFETALRSYLTFYRRSEFRTELTKAVALDGTTLYHLGRQMGFCVDLSPEVRNHVLNFE